MENKKAIHYVPDYFIEPVHPITIAVIGCGGTGSLILARLARLDQALRQLGHPGLMVIAYDGDIVESHNVGRQNFTKNDVGQYKAACIIQKINIAFGLQWDCENIYVKGDISIMSNIIITCVDNAKFRVALNDHFKKFWQSGGDYSKRYYWLDTGNGKDFGQVVLGTIGDNAKKERISEYDVKDILPNVIDIFGDISVNDTKEKQGIESCSFAESIEQQDLFINDSVAVQAVNILWRLLRDYKLFYHGVIINQATLQQRPIAVK